LLKCQLCGTKLPFATQANVSPWGGDLTVLERRFMPAKHILRTNGAPASAKSPAQERGWR